MSHPQQPLCQKPADVGQAGLDELAALPLPAILDQDWEQVMRGFPIDLEESARTAKALQRRRQVRSGGDLLRLVLVYALVDWPLRLTAAWATAAEVAALSDVALRKRLQRSQAWLQQVVAACLTRTHQELAGRSVHLRLIDASTVSRPGSQGTDWRLHLSFDLGQWSVDGVEVTDAKGGETLVRHHVRDEEIAVADRGYAHRRGIGSVLVEHGQIVVRINWQNLPLEDEAGNRLDLLAWLRTVPASEPGERTVGVTTPQGTFRLRLIARRLAPEAAAAARRRIREQARKQGRTPDARTLEAADFVVLVSTLDPAIWRADAVLALYRFRWQIELVFKRLKGVLCLESLRAQDAALAQVYVLGKLLGALTIDRWTRAVPAPVDEWWTSEDRPVSPWRWLTWWSYVLCRAVLGPIDLTRLLAVLPKLGRYLRDTPRCRPQQAAQARRLVALLQPTWAHFDVPVPHLEQLVATLS